MKDKPIILISAEFNRKEVKRLALDHEGAQFCDKNNSNCFNFNGRSIKLIGKDKLSLYIADKAIEAGAKKSR